LCLTALAGLPFHASAQVSAAASAPAAVSLADGYVLGIGDIVEVSVLGRDEFKPKTQIQADGTIQLPFVGIVDANNRTVLQLRNQVRRKLIAGGFYADPAVNVTVVGYSSRYIVVLGEVGTPGIVSIDRAYRVSEILARVGGAKSAGVDSITLTRQSGETINLSVTDVATGARTRIRSSTLATNCMSPQPGLSISMARSLRQERIRLIGTWTCARPWRAVEDRRRWARKSGSKSFARALNCATSIRAPPFWTATS